MLLFFSFAFFKGFFCRILFPFFNQCPPTEYAFIIMPCFAELNLIYSPFFLLSSILSFIHEPKPSSRFLPVLLYKDLWDSIGVPMTQNRTVCYSTMQCFIFLQSLRALDSFSQCFDYSLKLSFYSSNYYFLSPSWFLLPVWPQIHVFSIFYLQIQKKVKIPKGGLGTPRQHLVMWPNLPFQTSMSASLEYVLFPEQFMLLHTPFL